MKGWILFTALTLILVFTSPRFFAMEGFFAEGAKEVSRFSLEEGAFDVFDRLEQETAAAEENALRKGEIREKDEDPSGVSEAAGETPALESVLLFGGVFDKRAPFDNHTIEAGLDEKVAGHFVKGDLVDYRAFAFRDAVVPLEEPLSDEEVAFIFARIVSTYTAAVPIGGTLERIAFSRDGEELFAYALITVRFVELAEKYHLFWLPDHASFSLRIPFRVECGKIAVKSDEIELKCNTFYLPETLLVYGCNAAFGKKDYRKLFGNALENVFINAGIFN